MVFRKLVRQIGEIAADSKMVMSSSASAGTGAVR